MYRLWLHGLYGLYGPQCPLSPKRPINLISLSLCVFLSLSLCRVAYNGYDKDSLKSSHVRDGIFRLIWSITCWLIPWLLKAPGHQQAWYWQRIGYRYRIFHCESGLLLLNKIQGMIWNVNTSFISFKTMQHVKELIKRFQQCQSMCLTFRCSHITHFSSTPVKLNKACYRDVFVH